jgi:NAD(P)-dependent dehydrogenase (short-subunit alcohol dehydrogenase family)
MTLFDLRDRIVAVTGGLGQLGRQFSRALVEQGARVAVLDLPAQCALAQNSGLADGDRITLVPTDVTDRASLASALAVIERRWGAPFGLINNAALDVPPDAAPQETGPLEDYPLEAWRRTFDVNVTGTFLALQVFGARMAQAGQGSIANISSVYGLVSPDQRVYDYRRANGDPFYKPVAYAATKSAILNLTRYAATYWAPQGVRVNTLAFGGVFNRQAETFVQAYASRVPMARMAREDEYNGAVVFLMSDASSYMTGATMVLDGGWTAW